MMLKKATSIGGQALIEGIMMKGPKKTSLAVRLPDGSIDVDFMREMRLSQRNKFFGLPIIRGVIGYIEAMISGYKAMMISAERSGFTDITEDEETENCNKKCRSNNTENEISSERMPDFDGVKEYTTSADTDSDILKTIEITHSETVANDDNGDKKIANKKDSSIFMSIIMVAATVLGVALALVLFMWLPALLFDTVNSFTNGSISGIRAIFEGSLKLIIFVSYLAAVSQMKDIKRVFMYHGAEHKTIFCYESGEELTVDNVRKNSRFHPRCGTSFLILMLIVGVAINGILAAFFPVITANRMLWVAIKILILPLVCGVGYELIKICGRHTNIFTKIISAPGMWLQRLTTKEPEDSMIEIAIVALNAVIPENPNEDKF